MTPEKRRIAKNICKTLSHYYKNTFQYKANFLLKRADGIFIEGLLIEGTPYKDTFYVWSVVCPAWHLGSEPKLDYGNRLLDGKYLIGGVDEICEKVVKAVSVDGVARRRCCGPPTQIDEFLSAAESSAVTITKVDVETHNNLSHIFDKGVLLLLNGDMKGGYTALDAYGRRGHGRGKYASIAIDLISALNAGDGSWLDVIKRAQKKGRKAMGLPNEESL